MSRSFTESNREKPSRLIHGSWHYKLHRVKCKSCIQTSRHLVPELTYTPPPSPALDGTESGPSLEDHPHHQPLVMDPNPATSTHR